MNPTYQGITDQTNTMDPTVVNERVYDFVPGQDTKVVDAEKPAPPPGRRTTTNVIYEPSTDNRHPGRTSTITKGELEPEYKDDSSSNCLRTCFLSILVIVSLFLAIVAVVLVLLLWFNVIDPTECPSTATTVGSTDASSTGTILLL